MTEPLRWFSRDGRFPSAGLVTADFDGTWGNHDTERSYIDVASVDEPHRPASESAALLFVAARLRKTADEMESKAKELTAKPRRQWCNDLDPNWPDIDGRPRGPRLCVTYPQCPCGCIDAAKARELDGGKS